jgi:carboxymethylenebutenolidase
MSELFAASADGGPGWSSRTARGYTVLFLPDEAEAAYLGHFAETDAFEPQSEVDSLEASLRQVGRLVTFYHYRGTGHEFFEPDRTQAYNQAAVSLAWERTLAFLRRSPSL